MRASVASQILTADIEMAARFKTEPPADAQANPYLPKGPPDPLLFEEFQGINTSTSRMGVDDKQMWWCDGFMPIGPKLARTLPGVGVALYAGTINSVVFFDFINIGAVPYCLIIVHDGSIVAVNTNTGFASTIAAAGTIVNPSRTTVGISLSGNAYAIIVAKQTNGYFIWDGTTFYLPGASFPPGGTIPTGIGGTTIEIYAGRVWVANGPLVNFTAPGSLVDFSTGAGGGSFSSTDSFLRVQFTQLKQTNGFLYLVADSSINYISGVQTSGSPPITTFTNQNADPEVGTPWPGTVDVFGRAIIFANAFGAHISYGAAVTKISEALDGVYNTVPNFGGLTPSAAKATVFGKKVWILLLPIIDPVNGQQRNVLFMWSGKLWWATAQDVSLTFIQYQEINSVLIAYGTDGSNIYPLFSQPSAAFTKIIQSKLWATPGGYQFTKAAVRLWGILQYYSTISPALTIDIDNETSASSNSFTLSPPSMTWTTLSGTVMVWTVTGGAQMVWASTGIAVIPPESIGQVGVLIGLTAQTSAADMAILSLAIQDEIVAYRG